MNQNNNSDLIVNKSLLLGECKGCMREVLANSFDNEISKREFEISGLCQKCQKGIQP